MILVLAGTSEGRRAAISLVEAGFNVTATAVTEYGGSLLREEGVKDVLVGAFDHNRLSLLMEGKNIHAVVDATHPYAVKITSTALDLCAEKGVPYIRFERPASIIPDHPLVIKAGELDEAIDEAVSVGGVLFSTLGSRNLFRVIQRAQGNSMNVVARVLPDPKVLTECKNMGLKPNQIVAAQGPFSYELNREFFRFYGATVVITKESGDSGGVNKKVAAAMDLGIPVVIWMRPRFKYPMLVMSVEEVVLKLQLLRIEGGKTDERRYTPAWPWQPKR